MDRTVTLYKKNFKLFIGIACVGPATYLLFQLLTMSSASLRAGSPNRISPFSATSVGFGFVAGFFVMTPEVIDAAGQLLARHLVIFIVIAQPEVNRQAAIEPVNSQQMYETVAAQEMVFRREVLLGRLREHEQKQWLNGMAVRRRPRNLRNVEDERIEDKQRGREEPQRTRSNRDPTQGQYEQKYVQYRPRTEPKLGNALHAA